MLAAKKLSMRDIKLSGREAAVVRAIGFAESMLGAEILDSTRMEPEDGGDTLNGVAPAASRRGIPTPAHRDRRRRTRPPAARKPPVAAQPAGARATPPTPRLPAPARR